MNNKKNLENKIKYNFQIKILINVLFILIYGYNKKPKMSVEFEFSQIDDYWRNYLPNQDK